jgi:taurine transport system permease protein
MNQKSFLYKVLYITLPFLAIGSLASLWLWATNQNSTLIPSPESVLSRFIQLLTKPINNYTLIQHIGISVRRIMIALCCAITIGLVVGVLIGWSNIAKRSIGTLFEFIRPIPPIAWLPLIIMSFGLGEFPKVLIIFIATVAPIIINTSTGIRLVDSLYLDVGRSFHADKRQLLWNISLPAALPSIFAGIRNSISVGWTVVLAAEMMGATSGVGFLITRGMDFFDVPLIMAGILTVGIVGALISLTCEFIERGLCPWRKQQSN